MTKQLVPTLIGWKFQRVHDSTIKFILRSLNHSKGKMSLKTWITTRKRFGKLRRLSTQGESKELYNIKCDRQAPPS